MIFKGGWTKPFNYSNQGKKYTIEHKQYKRISIKNFHKRTKENYFQIGDKVLKWDSRREEKGKHGKFDSLWQGPYIIQATVGPNAFFLQGLDGTKLFGGPVNGRMLKHYFCWFSFPVSTFIVHTIAVLLLRKQRKMFQKNKEKREVQTRSKHEPAKEREEPALTCLKPELKGKKKWL